MFMQRALATFSGMIFPRRSRKSGINCYCTLQGRCSLARLRTSPGAMFPVPISFVRRIMPCFLRSRKSLLPKWELRIPTGCRACIRRFLVRRIVWWMFCCRLPRHKCSLSLKLLHRGPTPEAVVWTVYMVPSRITDRQFWMLVNGTLRSFQ